MSLAPSIDYAPPQAIDAEMAALGAALVSRGAMERVLELVREEDFYTDAHRKIFLAIAYLADRDRPADVLTVPEVLRTRGELEQVGGLTYLNSLVESVPTAAHVEHYCRIVVEKSLLRQLIGAADQVKSLVYNRDTRVEDIVEEAERIVFAVGQRRARAGFTELRPLLLDAMEAVEQAREADKNITGITTGFERLDNMTSGLQKGDLVIVAGRPSMGKTSLALGLAVNAASSEVPVAIFSLEMSAPQLAQRLLCSEARVDSNRLRTGHLRSDTEHLESDWTRLGRAIGFLGELPIWIDDSSDLNCLELRARCRRLRSEHGLGLVVVDYLQLISAHGRQDNRNQEISLIARSLKSMARELECPVIALSQLSRNVERREDKRPMLSDLRESGSIEAEADLVMMLFRTRYYERHDAEGETAAPRQGEEDLEEAELIVAKHRNGPVGSIHLGFLRRYARFTSLAAEYSHERD